MAAVDGVKDRDLLRDCFSIGMFRGPKKSDDLVLKAIVEKFLLGESFYQPTWRAVIYCLDRAGEVAVADKIRSFSEPVQGGCICTMYT